MATDYYNIVGNQEMLEKQMLFYSSFLMVYENFSCTWKQAICFLYYTDLKSVDSKSQTFYCPSRFILKERNDFYRNSFNKLDPNLKQRLKNEVFKTKTKRKKNRPESLSIFRWMVKHSFITVEDYKILYKCHFNRNLYAHEIDHCLRTFVSEEDISLFKKMISISEKASQNWAYRVTIPSHPDKQQLIEYFDSDGNKVELKPEYLLTGTSIFYSLVLSNLDNIKSWIN